MHTTTIDATQQGQGATNRNCLNIVKVYRSIEELPELLEPGKHIVEGVETTVYKLTGREELVLPAP